MTSSYRRREETSSSGYTYDREVTVTYNVNGPPTQSGFGSGSSWSHTDSQSSAQSDSTSHFWIGRQFKGVWDQWRPAFPRT